MSTDLAKLLFYTYLMLLPALAQGEIGVTETVIKLGQSLPTDGPSAPRALAYKSGSDLYFRRINESGGISGRKIELVSYNDHYEPKLTVENTRKLILEDKVFALFELFGTPTVKAVLPLVERERIPLITPVSGASFLRTPVVSGVFVLRASDVEEAQAAVSFLSAKRSISEISLFYQDDALGASGKEALTASLSKLNLVRKSEASYKRNEIDVDEGVQKIMATKPSAVVIWGVASAAAKIIKSSIAKGFRPVFFVSSIADTPEFLQEVGSVDADIYISQPVPFLDEGSAPIVKDYLKDATSVHHSPDLSEFEGYLNAAFFSDALKKTGKDVTRENLFKTLESMNSDIGGVKISLSPKSHQGLSAAVIMKVTRGKFVTVR